MAPAQKSPFARGDEREEEKRQKNRKGEDGEPRRERQPERLQGESPRLRKLGVILDAACVTLA